MIRDIAAVENGSVALARQEQLWSLLNAFFEPFDDHDWAQPHGAQWSFADVPYHLGCFNQLVTQAIAAGDRNRERQELATVAELDQWNRSRFAARRRGQTGAHSLDWMRATQHELREAVCAAVESGREARVWLPVLWFRGWHTLGYALEYNTWHTWLHLSEAQLRRDGRLPATDAALLHDLLRFHMGLVGGAANLHAAEGGFCWAVQLSGAGGGAWTFDVTPTGCQVALGSPPRADITIKTDIATFLRTVAFEMQNPVAALLLGKMKVAGLRNFTRLQAIFTPAQDFVWPRAPRPQPGAVPTGLGTP